MIKSEIDNFCKAVDSLRLYQRYEIVDDNNKDILDKVYVDPIEGNGILNLCMKDNTTVLIGRKGTGKSTIYMRMQNELRKSKDIMTCYIDVKTIFDNAKRSYTTINYLKLDTSKEIEDYSLQRQFVLDFLTELIKEIRENYVTVFERIKGKFHINSKVNSALEKLIDLQERIQNNSHLQDIELQTLQSIELSDATICEHQNSKEERLQANLSYSSAKVEASSNNAVAVKQNQSNEKKFNRVFARIFEINDLVKEIKDVLQELSMKRLFIILDDYSEIEKDSLSMFCDLIVNALNNASDNYIKFKISAYPGRVELGELDRQKIDIRYLDYYQLYVNDKRNEMEACAIDYTWRIIETRLQVYTGHGMDYYFDTEKANIEQYCELIFKMSMNVVRHIGLILDYAKDNAILQGHKITINNLNEASKRFYVERLSLFFEESKSAKMAYQERIEKFQLKELLDSMIAKQKAIKADIRKNKYTAVIFDSDRGNPYTSHFYITKELEHILASLELNFFVSKYNEMSNKSGKKVSIYALNYGLCLLENIKWGKPLGNEYRTYYIESPFNFNMLLTDFLKQTKEIKCINCGYVYSEDDLSLLKRHSMNCMECLSPNSVKIQEKISDIYRVEIAEIEKNGNLLEKEQFNFMKLACLKNGIVSAKDMAMELDITWQKIGWITKKLEEDYYYLKKERKSGRTMYILTELGKDAMK